MKKVFVLLFSTLTIWANNALISPEWLSKNLNNKDIRVIEVSNEDNYELGHIEGALHTSIGKWREKHGEYLTIRSIKEIESEISRLGITPQTHVILYASYETPKEFLKATYVYWALEYMGVKNVSVLDGGLKNWITKGYKTTQEKRVVAASNYKATIDKDKVADLAYVKSHISKLPMIDARPADKYLGITPTATVKRDGHIKGAMSYSWNYSINADYTLKSKQKLKSLMTQGYKLDPNKEVLVYCTGGLETSFNYFLLSGVLEFKKVRLYDASMKEWGNREETLMSKYQYEIFK
jgi:thiosulfate/3-mercaptopyruvate sulfurtransferase